MEEECRASQQENQRLQSVVRSLEVEVSELRADAETRGSALESLEQTLGKIERSADSGRDRSPLTGGSSSITVRLLGSSSGEGAEGAVDSLPVLPLCVHSHVPVFVTFLTCG